MGRVLQFDQARGYGFVAADDGGEDVFLHASVVDGGADALAPGMRLEFKIMAGDRGRKAFAARVVDDSDEASSPAPPLPAPPPSSAGEPSAQQPEEEKMCDVLSADELATELTERLLQVAPGLTGHQILQVRQTMLDIAKQHSWSDG